MTADIAIWNRALTDAELEILSKGVRAYLACPEGLLLYAPCVPNRIVVEYAASVAETVVWSCTFEDMQDRPVPLEYRETWLSCPPLDIAADSEITIRVSRDTIEEWTVDEDD
jgi:hypothetical protein